MYLNFFLSQQFKTLAADKIGLKINIDKFKMMELLDKGDDIIVTVLKLMNLDT